MDESLLVALVVGLLQGVFEWLPVSSEGNISIALTALGTDPGDATRFSLFVHLGTACSATVYYRETIGEALADVPDWRPRSAFAESTADVSFLAVATLASGVVGIAAYLALDALVTALAGGAFVAVVGGLLVVTGLVLRGAGEADFVRKRPPNLLDAVLVGALQGLAILPGVSRSGTTASALLLRGHDGPSAFRLSFLLSIPAAAGAAGLVFLDVGVPAMNPVPAAVAILTAAVVGYLTIDALMRVVERVDFWAVCLGLGSLAIAGGAALVVL